MLAARRSLLASAATSLQSAGAAAAPSAVSAAIQCRRYTVDKSTAEGVPVGEHHGSRLHGSTHWTYERLASAALLPVTGYALIGGPCAVNDMLLGVLVPLHCHIGLDGCIVDYIPARRMPRANKAAQWALRLATLGLLYGCWRINTQDVGITETFRRIWRAKEEHAKSQGAAAEPASAA